MSEPIILDGKVTAVYAGSEYSDGRRRVRIRIGSNRYGSDDIRIADDALQCGDEVQVVLERRSVPAVDTAKV